MSDREILAWLDANAIVYRRLEPGASIDPAPARAKSLLVRDRRGGRYVLVVSEREQRVDLQRLAGWLGMRKLRFASEDELAGLLGTAPGRVGLPALANDREHRVEVVIEERVLRSAVLACPLPASSAAVAIAPPDVVRVLERTGHTVRVCALPAPPATGQAGIGGAARRT